MQVICCHFSVMKTQTEKNEWSRRNRHKLRNCIFPSCVWIVLIKHFWRRNQWKSRYTESGVEEVSRQEWRSFTTTQEETSRGVSKPSQVVVVKANKFCETWSLTRTRRRFNMKKASDEQLYYFSVSKSSLIQQLLFPFLDSSLVMKTRR